MTPPETLPPRSVSFPVQPPVLNGLRQMHCIDLGTPGKIGNRTTDLEQSHVAASRQAKPVGDLLQQLFSVAISAAKRL